MEHALKPSASNAIEISVVISVRNEQESMAALLDGLLSQTLLPKEIVITDAGSSDSTREIIEAYIEHGAPVELIRESNALPGRGRNLGVQHSTCEWIAFTDGGTRPEPDWLKNLAGRVRDGSSVDVVYGSYEPVVDSFFKECAVIAYLTPPVEVAGHLARSRFIASALMRRRVWEEVGGFAEHLRSGEDLLFMQRIDEKGFHTVRAPQAVVHWSIQPSLWLTFKRFLTYARHNLRAGLWRRWQAPIFLRYTLLVVITLPLMVVGVRWLLVPLICWVGLLLARAAKALFMNRTVYPAGAGHNLLRLAMLVPIIATLDLALFIGSLNWLVLDKLHLAGAKTKQ